MEHQLAPLLTHHCWLASSHECHKTFANLRHCQNVWCSGMVLSHYRQSEDPLTTSVGIESGLGWPCTPTHQRCLVAVGSMLQCLSEKQISRYYSLKGVIIESIQLHGFSHASADAYAGVTYLHLTDSDGNVHISLVIAKTKVASIKRLTIPRLELCGAHLLTQLLNHIKEIFHHLFRDIYAWTDSTTILNWLSGNPRHFKTYVGNRVSSITEHIPPDEWNYVSGMCGEPSRLCIQRSFPIWIVRVSVVVERPPFGSNYYHPNGPNNQLFLLLGHLMKKGTLAYWLPFNQS